MISCWPGSTSAAPGAQQLRGPRAGRHPQRDQRPVPVRPELGEQPVEHLIRDLPRDPPRVPRPIQPGPLGPERLHRVVMRVRPAPRCRGPAGTGSPSARSPPRGGSRRTPAAPSRSAPASTPRTRPAWLARHRFGTRAAGGCRQPERLVPTQPAAEVAGLHPGRLIPPDVDRPHEPEPAQQVHRIRPLRRRRAARTPADPAETPPPARRPHHRASTSRYGSNRSPVASSAPQRSTISDDRSRAPSPSLITGTEPNRPGAGQPAGHGDPFP